MTNTKVDQITKAELNLQRKLEWVSRFDGRIGFVAGLIVAMLGVLASASAAIIKWSFSYYVIFIIAGLPLFISLGFIYASQYPKVRSLSSSLLFFGTIAKLKYDEFASNFKNQTDDEYLDDLLSQTYRNSEILTKKFSKLKTALILVVASILPWLVAIYLSKIYIK